MIYGLQSRISDQEMIRPSVWLRVVADDPISRDIWVERQGYWAATICHSISRNNALRGLNFSIFIVTPFRRVELKFKQYVKKFKKDNRISDGNSLFSSKWNNQNIGTIHKFQGKEADVVVVLTGLSGRFSGPAQTIMKNKPNLINVAVSRAKKYIYFVGDDITWREVPYWGTVFEHVSVRPPASHLQTQQI